MLRVCWLCLLGAYLTASGCSRSPSRSAKQSSPASAVQAPFYSAQSIVPVDAREPGPLAPGMVAVVYGRQLGPESACDGSDANVLLCGTQVIVGGKSAGLLYVSAGQINFRVPRETAPSGTVDVRISHNGSVGPPVSVPVRAAAPGGYSAQIAERMLGALDAIRWNTRYSGGCTAVPPHQAFRGGLHDYAYYCGHNNSGVIVESLYYPIDGDPPRLLLRRTDIRTENEYPELSEEVERILAERLTRVYGVGKIPNNLFEIGASRPRPGLSWHVDDATIFLHRNRTHLAPVGLRDGVTLIAVHREVLAERDAQVEPSANYPRTEPERVAAERATRSALLNLLGQSGANRNVRAGNLVVADSLVVKLGSLLMVGSGEAPNANEVKRRLARYGIRYTGVGHYSGALEYDRSLLQRAWKEFPDTAWGQRAFLMLQRLSCALPGYGCDGPNCFLAVIERGEKFLRDYPDTQLRTRQLQHLALANETWWSLSWAEPGDITAEGAKVTKASGERARLRAIELYEEVIRSAPDTSEARAARRALPRLKLKLPTGERTFFCWSC